MKRTRLLISRVSPDQFLHLSKENCLALENHVSLFYAMEAGNRKYKSKRLNTLATVEFSSLTQQQVETLQMIRKRFTQVRTGLESLEHILHYTFDGKPFILIEEELYSFDLVHAIRQIAFLNGIAFDLLVVSDHDIIFQ